MKKKNKCAAKKKEQVAKLCIFGRSPSSFYLKSPFFLLSYFMPAPVFALMTTLLSHPRSSAILSFCYVSVPVFYSRFIAVFSFYCMTTLVSYPKSIAILSSYYVLAPAPFAAFFLLYHALISFCGISALLLPIFLLNPPFFLGSLFFKIFKQSLSNNFWSYVSTIFVKSFYLFPPFGAYNLNNNKNLHNLTNTNQFK